MPARRLTGPADHVHVGMLLHGVHELGDLARVVLPVGVDLDQVVVTVLEGELEPRLHGPADPEVERMAQHPCAATEPLAAGGVGGPVVDDNDVEPGCMLPEGVDYAPDRRRLVVGGHHGKAGAF